MCASALAFGDERTEVAAVAVVFLSTYVCMGICIHILNDGSGVEVEVEVGRWGMSLYEWV